MASIEVWLSWKHGFGEAIEMRFTDYDGLVAQIRLYLLLLLRR
ncbi:hypothetical protein O9929_04895 [Vibrio lentus]|nr:hypothetical protein [Vibrio lentus]